jgi:hypothetical protein
MSGICGVIGSVSTPKPGHLVAAMLKAIAHRGPDGANFYSSEESGVALGHNHLKTFAAAAGFAETDAVAVALDGGVTNRAAIGAAAPVRANPDTQAVLAAYQAHGEDFLSRLDGPLSLALWDKQKRRLILSRDKLGEKSLYYYFDPQQETLVFASEIKAILAHPAVRTELDWDSLSLYFAFGYIPRPRTLFKDIFKLLPGESLQWGFSRPLEKRKYWHLPHIADGVDDEAYCIRQLKELFMQGLAAYVNGCQDVAVSERRRGFQHHRGRPARAGRAAPPHVHRRVPRQLGECANRRGPSVRAYGGGEIRHDAPRNLDRAKPQARIAPAARHPAIRRLDHDAEYLQQIFAGRGGARGRPQLRANRLGGRGRVRRPSQVSRSPKAGEIVEENAGVRHRRAALLQAAQPAF